LFSTLSASKLQKNLPEVERLFMESTNQLVTGDKITPGGFYTGVWCRDASYILNELVEMGRNEAAGRWLEWIWAHGVNGSINVVHGRGSPEMGYKSRVVTGDFRQKFDGLLPSSIQLGYIEVYGKSPDIDSTALMISVTCRYCSEATGSTGCDTLIRHVERAISSLQNRDVDGDLLLEQGPNEDWMDTMLRSGRVVYSQAAWGRALLDWSKLLHKIGRSNDAEKTYEGARELARAINQKLWSDQSKSYSDSPEGYDGYKLDSDRVYAASQSSSSTNGNAAQTASQNTWLTQDASLFLLMMDSLDSASDGNNNDNNYAGGRSHRGGLPADDNNDDDNNHRAGIFLETLKARSWRGGTGAACLDPPTSVTGPFKWGPNMYQNGGFWPWISSLEILARLRYDPSIENTAGLLIKSMRYSFLEWVNPVGTGSGAYPFRTSIAAVRTALRHFSRTANR
jgi:glycogen debranching enzyme